MCVVAPLVGFAAHGAAVPVAGEDGGLEPPPDVLLVLAHFRDRFRRGTGCPMPGSRGSVRTDSRRGSTTRSWAASARSSSRRRIAALNAALSSGWRNAAPVVL